MKIRGASQTDAKAIAEIYNVDLGYKQTKRGFLTVWAKLTKIVRLFL